MERKFGDRYDGRRVRNCDPFNIIIPYIMTKRNDAQVFFDIEIDMKIVDGYLRKKKESGMKSIGMLDFLITALVRTISQYPRINRFVAGQRLFTRNEISISMAVKKEMNINSDETTVKFAFNPADTIYDIEKIIDNTVNKNKGAGIKNNTDKLVKMLIKTPRLILKSVVGSIKLMDYFGIMPKSIHKLSPFHASVFVTNMGSIGSKPIYHHLYNFGTVSLFVAFGMRTKKLHMDKDNKDVVEKKVLNIRCVADERIGDGYYLSSAIKYFASIFENPEILENPPETVLRDE